MALGPIGLDLDRLLGIFESFLVFVLGGVDGGAVGVENVVFRFDGKGLGEFDMLNCSKKGVMQIKNKTTRN